MAWGMRLVDVEGRPENARVEYRCVKCREWKDPEHIEWMKGRSEQIPLCEGCRKVRYEEK